MKPKKRPFLKYIHDFRGIAIVFATSGHIVMNWNSNSNVEHIIFSIFRNGTVLFIFIAGFLFQYLSYNYRTLDYWKRKLKYVIAPYLIISSLPIIYRFYYVPDYLLELYPDFMDWSMFRKAVWYIVTGSHMVPFWFVPMIFLFYLVAPILIKLDRSPKLYWILVFSVVVSLVFPRKNYGELHKIFYMFMHFFSVYMFGMFCSHYIDKVLEISKKYYLLFTTITITLLISSFFDWKYYNQIMYLQKMSLCWFFIYWLNVYENKIPSFTKLLADYSFGLFFIHFLVIIFVKWTYQKFYPELLQGSILNWALYFSLMIGISIISIYLIKRVTNGYSRYFIGC